MMGSRGRLASRISHSVLQMVTRLSYPLYSSRKDDGSPTAHPAPWHRAPPLILSHLPNHSLPWAPPPTPLCSKVQQDNQFPWPRMSLLLALPPESFHFPQSRTSTTSSIVPPIPLPRPFTAKQSPLLFPSHMLSCAFTQYR